MSRKREAADLRVRRTRKALREALVSVVEEEGYRAAKVKEITERAMVNKATFYLHYEDKYDLLLDVIGERFGALSARNSPPPDPPASLSLQEPPEALVGLLEHVATHAGFYSGVLGEGGSEEIRSDVRTYAEGLVSQRIRAAVGDVKGAVVPAEFVAGYTAAAALGTISWWLEKGTPYEPRQVATWLLVLISIGAHRALGLEAPAPPRTPVQRD